MSAFIERLEEIRARIDRAASAAGRTSDEITIVGVTKTFGPEAVAEAWNAGVRIIGENKVQEAAAKQPLCPSGPEWHLIGHLQRNKVRGALELFSCIHSVDSAELIAQISRLAAEIGARPRILLEVNVSGEPSKFGLTPGGVPAAIEAAFSAPEITLEGFMTMAPFSPKSEDARPYFAALRTLRDEMETRFRASFPELSMGMSGDFEPAVMEGATLVRIGSALFGKR